MNSETILVFHQVCKAIVFQCIAVWTSIGVYWLMIYCHPLVCGASTWLEVLFPLFAIWIGLMFLVCAGRNKQTIQNILEPIFLFESLF